MVVNYLLRYISSYQVDIRVVALDRPLPPGLDVPVDLLVQLADRRGADLRTPQRLGDVLHSAYRHASKVHLDQGLLDRGLPATVALDDRRLECLLAQLRHLELHLAGLCLQLALIAAGPGVSSRLGALVACRIA